MKRYVIMGPRVVKLCVMQDFITRKPIRDCGVHRRQASDRERGAASPQRSCGDRQEF